MFVKILTGVLLSRVSVVTALTFWTKIKDGKTNFLDENCSVEIF